VIYLNKFCGVFEITYKGATKYAVKNNHDNSSAQSILLHTFSQLCRGIQICCNFFEIYTLIINTVYPSIQGFIIYFIKSLLFY